MVRIEKKCWPITGAAAVALCALQRQGSHRGRRAPCDERDFQAIVDGRKTFEIRLADWACEPGDALVIKEWDPATEAYTGRAMEKTVTYVGKTQHVEAQGMYAPEDIDRYGFQVIAFRWHNFRRREADR